MLRRSSNKIIADLDSQMMKSALQSKGRTESRKVKVEGDIKSYIASAAKYISENNDKDNIVLLRHLADVIKATNNPNRLYSKIMGNTVDSHHELEKTGFVKYGKVFTTIIDFTYRLDLILALVSGCNADRVRAIPDYKDFSRAIMTVDLQKLEEFSMSCILGIDENLDNFLGDLSEKMFTEDTFIVEFFRIIHTTTADILYLTADIVNSMSQQSSAIRSKGAASIVLSSDEDLNQVINFVIKDSTYDLEIRSFRKGGYAEWLKF